MKTVIIVALFACAVLAQQGAPPPPPFLEGAPQATIDSFHQLLGSAGSLTDAQIDAKVDAWVQTQSAAIKTKYTAFKGELKQHQAAAEAAHKAAVAKFSPAAKAADAKLAAIAQNPSLSAQAKGQQIEALLGGLPANVRQEIQSAMQGGQ
ncbi:hypothetical protein FO519_003108 [Halicephalobus sp. NKZ332]|nr:hypothetical protein FO519_003108 [Halicephalobus sp. NKZ332]